MEWKKEEEGIVGEIDRGGSSGGCSSARDPRGIGGNSCKRQVSSIGEQSADGCVVPRFCRLRREKGPPLLDARTSRVNRKQLNSVQE